jgi:hypothetical protein
MSPFENHDEPWLRDALGALLVDEPPMSPVAVVDDVRRGAVAVAVVKRRRTVTFAVAAALLAVAVPVGLVLRAAPNASVTPPATSKSPTPVTTFTPPSLDAALVNTGWQAVGEPQPLNSSPSWAYLLQPSDGTTTESANVMVFAAQQTTPGPYLAACTKVTCPGGTSVTIADGATATSGYRETSTVAGEGLLVPRGSLIVDKAYGTGTLVEVVVTPPWNNARDVRTPVTATSILTLEQTRAIVALLGDPFSPSASPSSTSGVHFVPNADWPAAVTAALPGTATALDGASVSPDGTVAVVNIDLVRDGVGTFVRVRLDSPTTGSFSPLENGPCYLTNLGADCRVTQPWTTTTVDGSTVETSVQEVSYPENSAGSRYAGSYSVRTLVQVQGQTMLTITSDSRDTDSSGQWASSTVPALSTEELVSLARTMPFPYAFQPAVQGALWGSSELAPRGPVAYSAVSIPACETDLTKPANQQSCLDGVGAALSDRSLYYAGGSAMTFASVDPAVADVATWFQAHASSAASGYSRDSELQLPGTSTAPVVTTWNVGPSKATFYACPSGTGLTVGTAPCPGSTAGAAPAVAGQTSAQTAAAVAHPCRASDLSVSLSRDGAGGTVLRYYAFRNTSTQACGLTGYPTLAGPHVTPLPLAVRYGVHQITNDAIPPVTPLLVAPDTTVTSLVTKYRCDVGVASTVSGLVATVPGDSTAIPLPDSALEVCVGGASDPGNEIDVSAFHRAAG